MIVNNKCVYETEKKYIPDECFRKSIDKPKLLLHSCCGPCSTSVVERLVDEFDVTVFFYNPCITDEKEYRRRYEAQVSFIEQFNIENAGKTRVYLREGGYRPAEFFSAVEGFEKEPEGGARCHICFRQRLEKTAGTASLSGYDYFGTTLTVSPHKSYKIISETGRQLALRYGLTFLDRDFKKKDGFKRSIELSAKYGLYRQDYCGCEYSKR